MPYKLEGNCVVKADTGETVKGGCHETHDEAVAHLAALNMNVKDSLVARGVPTHNKDDKDVNYVDDCNMCEQRCDLCKHYSQRRCDVVIGEISPQGHCDFWEPSGVDSNLSVTMSMVITKASYDKKTSQTRFSAVASDTSVDAFVSRMTLELFQDFIARMESGEQVPVVLRSEFWSGGMPYVSLSHYLDLNGFAVVGVVTEAYVDGDRFKIKGVFGNDLNPELARAAYESVKQDILNDVPLEERIRLSIAFLDWQHRHSLNSFVFTRAKIEDRCPICVVARAKGDVVEYTKGHLFHVALTRVPANKGTELALEERAMPTNQLEDAASIVGKDLAEDVDKRAKDLKVVERSGAIVVKSESEPGATPPAAAEPPVVEPPVEQRDTLAFTTNHVKAMMQGKTHKDMMKQVMMSIFDSADIIDKRAAVAIAVDEFMGGVESRALAMLASFESQPNAEGVTSMPDGDKTPHPLDEYFTKLRTAYDASVNDATLKATEKLAKIQAPADELGAAIKRAVQAATPQSPEDLQNIVRTEVQAAFQQLMPQLAQVMGQQRSAVGDTPAPRQAAAPSLIQLSNAAPKPGNIPAPGQQGNKSFIDNMVRRSVVGNARANAEGG
jgi:hypothetical protein